MRKPTCVPCQIGMEQVKIGLYCASMFSDPPQPYKIWAADKYQCPICGHEVLSGYGDRALMEHFQEGFEEYVKRIKDRTVKQYERCRDVSEDRLRDVRMQNMADEMYELLLAIRGSDIIGFSEYDEVGEIEAFIEGDNEELAKGALE